MYSIFILQNMCSLLILPQLTHLTPELPAPTPHGILPL